MLYKKSLFRILFLVGSLGFIMMYAIIANDTDDRRETYEIFAYFGIVALPVSLLSVSLKLFVWKKCLDSDGENLIIASELRRYVFKIDEVRFYEIQKMRKPYHKIIFHTTSKKITIYPAALVGGLAACREYLARLGVEERSVELW